MIRTLSNRIKTYHPYGLVFVTMLLTLLTSCPIKSGIKSLAGIPINVEQGHAKSGVVGNILGQCMSGSTTDSVITKSMSHHTNKLLPSVIFIAAFLLLLGFRIYKGQSNLFYRKLKVPNIVPLFLQYRKLVI